METFKLDDRVRVIGKNAKGRIAFMGKIHLSNGIMYGIALDKPKGRCSGTIGGVRYFVCPEDHGVFVRACQLEVDSGNSSDDTEDYKDVIPRPTYPNYLKHSSKLNFKKSKYPSKRKEHVSKVKSPLKQDAHTKKTSEDHPCSGSTHQQKLVSDPGIKVKKNRRLSRKPVQDRASIDAKFRFLAEKIDTQAQQLDTIRRYLKKLKTYIRWSRGYETKENQMKILLDGAIDSVIGNMEELYGSTETTKGSDHDHGIGDAGFETENALLLQCIWDLENKNGTLVECMTKIRALLLKSYRPRSHGKYKKEANRQEISGRPNHSGNKSPSCSHKKPETRSVPNLPTDSPRLDEVFRKDRHGKGETIQRFLESLSYADGNKNQVASSSILKKEKRPKEKSKGDAQKQRKVSCVKDYIESLNLDIKELNKELNGMQGEKCRGRCEPRVSSKSNLLSQNIESHILQENRNSDSCKMIQPRRSSKDNNRLFNPYSSAARRKRDGNYFNQNADTIETEKDPTKELFELISNIMTNINLNEQNEISPKDSLNAQEKSIIHSEMHVRAGRCYSNPDSEKFEKMPNSPKKSEPDHNLRPSKSVPNAKMTNEKSPKKRVQKKLTMDSRKQPTQNSTGKKD